MFAWFYDAGPHGHWVFFIVTVMLGGLAAYATGRALAQTWRRLWLLPLATALLTCAVRFIHYAVFEERLLSAQNFAVDMAVVTVAALVGYMRTRRQQMARQYPWVAAVQPSIAPSKTHA